MRFALASDDKAEATRRFIALMLKPQTSDQSLAEMGSLIFSEPTNQAHQTLVELLVGTQKWHSVFVSRGLNALPTEAYVEALIGANQHGVEFDCNQLQLSARALERRPESQIASKAIKDLIARQCR